MGPLSPLPVLLIAKGGPVSVGIYENGYLVIKLKIRRGCPFSYQRR
jgi:hypothetical protein